MDIEINLLKPHPKNAKIYGNESVDELARQIELSGWVKPLVVTKEYLVVSGHRRLKAVGMLGFDVVPCEIVEFGNDTDILERLLLENETRNKTNAQRAREFQMWEVVEKERAKERMECGINQYSPMENFPHPSDKGKSRDFAAEKSGFANGRTAQDASRVVVEIEKRKNEGKALEAEVLEAALNKSVNGALKLSKKELTELDMDTPNKIESGELKVSQINKSIKEERMQRASDGLKVLQMLEKKKRKIEQIKHEIIQLETLLEKNFDCYQITEECYLIGKGSLPKIYNVLMQNLNLK